MTVCARHPERPAQHVCASCAAPHCAACIRRVKAGTSYLDACSHCDGILRVIDTPPPPPRAQVAADLWRPFSKEGVLAALAVALPGLVPPLPLVRWVAAFAFFVAASGYYFAIVRHVADGGDGLPPSEELFGEHGGVLDALARGLAALVATALPAAGLALLADVSSGAAMALALLAGAAIAPAAILAIALGARARDGLNPFAWTAVITRAPRPYAELLLQFVVSGLAWFFATWVAGYFFGPMPVVGRWLALAAGTLVLFAQASLVGGFLRRNGKLYGR